MVTEVIRATTAASIPAIAMNATVSFTLTVPGAAIGSSVFLSPNGTLDTGTIIAYARVTAANPVTVWANTAPGNRNLFYSSINGKWY